ncbi:hypothetical protein J1N35_000756 [Gossypium stocksii]|uniref:Uncharacterized protein n=1 Tax=Gossypium stocksii TaxID=47602 RepID=A0A9D4AL27_9ROSI|nr:hypothetical protein J1N35_000756 [Gossypium stocksii]
MVRETMRKKDKSKTEKWGNGKNSEAFHLFVLEKAVGKFGLSVSKLAKKIKAVNFKEVPTMGIAKELSYRLVNRNVRKTLREHRKLGLGNASKEP